MSKHPSPAQPHDVSVSRCHSLSSLLEKDPLVGQNATVQPWQSHTDKPWQRKGISAKPQAQGFRKKNSKVALLAPKLFCVIVRI